MIKSPNLGREEGLRVSVTTDAAEPISTADMKTYLKVDYSDDDDIIDELITTARKMVENYIQRKVGSQTLKAYWTAYGKYVRLPFAPVNSVTTVKTIEKDNTETLTVNTDYFLLGDDQDKYLEMSTWGKIGLEVVYTAGYSTVPNEILIAIKRTVARYYEFRGDDVEDYSLDKMTRKILSPYRVPSI